MPRPLREAYSGSGGTAAAAPAEEEGRKTDNVGAEGLTGGCCWWKAAAGCCCLKVDGAGAEGTAGRPTAREQERRGPAAGGPSRLPMWWRAIAVLAAPSATEALAERSRGNRIRWGIARLLLVLGPGCWGTAAERGRWVGRVAPAERGKEKTADGEEARRGPRREKLGCLGRLLEKLSYWS